MAASTPEASIPEAKFSHRVDVRYFEVDQQGVVFNMWYLAYFDDAMTAWLAARGVPYRELFAAGLDVQLVHTEVDWRGGVGFGDDLRIGVTLAALGRTSLTLDFSARRDGVAVVTGRTVYVVVATDGGGKQALPDWLRAALAG